MAAQLSKPSSRRSKPSCCGTGLRGAETLKTIGAATYARWKLDSLYADLANTSVRIQKLALGSGALVNFTTGIASLIVLFLGADLVMKGEVSIGTLVAFTMFAGALYGPMSGLVGSWGEYQEALNSVERINDILQKAPEAEEFDPSANLIRMPRPRGGIRFTKVPFRYHPDDPSNVLQNFSLDIEPGQKVALVGQSGCGKSTVLKLIFAMHRPADGRIQIDGFDTSDVWVPSLRQHIGTVPQNGVIMAGTVRENIAFARPDAPLNETIAAAKLAEAHDFIMKMPHGYNSVLQERGSNLSGGQRQRIAIARVFLQRLAILLLDEATSALDTDTERRIIGNLERRFARSTVVTVAHRLSTVRNADLIVVLNRGMVAETGTFEELTEARGLFYRLNRTGDAP